MTSGPSRFPRLRPLALGSSRRSLVPARVHAPNMRLVAALALVTLAGFVNCASTRPPVALERQGSGVLVCLADTRTGQAVLGPNVSRNLTIPGPTQAPVAPAPSANATQSPSLIVSNGVTLTLPPASVNGSAIASGSAASGSSVSSTAPLPTATLPGFNAGASQVRLTCSRLC